MGSLTLLQDRDVRDTSLEISVAQGQILLQSCSPKVTVDLAPSLVSNRKSCDS